MLFEKKNKKQNIFEKYKYWIQARRDGGAAKDWTSDTRNAETCLMRMCVRLRTMQSTVLRRAKEPTNSVEDEGQEVTMR